MRTDRKAKIHQITDNKSIRLRESYIQNNFSDVYEQISAFTFGLELTFIERIWHWVNDFPNYFLCKCGERTKFNRNWLDGYKKNCSAKCAQSNVSTKEKRKNTTLEKWGVDNIAKLDSVKEKQAKTNLDKWGTKSSFQNSEVRDKWKKTISDKWGVDHYFKTDEFKVQSKSFYLKKWGVDHPLKVEEIKERIKKTPLSRYGVLTYLNTEHSRSMIKKTNKSSYEDEICLWLDSLSIGYIRNNSHIINPLSIDIYIDKFKLAIEFNGLYWHSEFFKDKKYHLNKTNLCKEEGIHLIHIWEDDWLSRKEVIKSIILNKLNLSSRKIYARKCQVSKITDNKIVSDFLNKNHLQGYTRFSDSFGLFFDGELVSCVCFGWRSTNGKKEYELIRFCNKLDYNIIGSAGKLFNHFLRVNPDLDSITSYADISIFDGNLYGKLGFEKVGLSNVNYWWVVKGIRKHRFNYNKAKLVKMGFDKTKTEVEIMHEMNAWRVWGCGQEKWIWKKF